MDALADGLGGLSELKTKAFSEVASGSYNYFENGDVLLAKVTPCFENGKKAIASDLENGAGFATSEVLVFRPDSDRIDTRYLRYLFSAEDFRHRGIASMTGAGGLRRVSERAVLDFPLHITDLPTQRAIADFLDRETARIDLLIEKKQRLVALLGEKFRSDIHDLFHSLDAETWRIRHTGKIKNGAGFPVELQGDPSNEIPFFKVKHLAVNGLDQRITESEDTITKETARTLRATVFPSGTIVFAKIGAALLLGRFSMLGVEGCIDNNLAAFVVNKRLVDPDYLLLCLERLEMPLLVQPGAVPSLSTEKFINQSLPLPPLDGQRELVEKVRRLVKRNGRIAQRTQDSIARLKEYRSCLITAAVTGQIDVSTYTKSSVSDRDLDAIQEEMGA
nr:MULTISPECIES: restriction endonuclease subunit S [unclassified Aliiroseovarius]